MKLGKDLEFGWRHVFAPTPKNVELFLKSSRRILVGIGGSTFLAGVSDWVLFGCMVGQLVLEEAAGFIGEAIKPGDTVKETFEYPAEVADQVNRTVEVVPAPTTIDETPKDTE